MSFNSRIDLPDVVRKSSCGLLQARLSDALDLGVQLKQAHWNVRGRNFFQLHQLFDLSHDEVEEFVDHLAERIAALGEIADGRSQTTARSSALPPYPLEIRDGVAHLTAVADALGAFASSVRRAIDEATAHGDADTADLFTEISRAIDKQLWMVEAHLA